MLNRIIYNYDNFYFSITQYEIKSTFHILFEDGEFTIWRFSIKIVYSPKKHIFSKMLEKLIKRLITTNFTIVSGFDGERPDWGVVPTIERMIEKLCEFYENKEFVNGFDRNHIKPRKY